MEDPITHKWNWNLDDPKNVWGPVGWRWLHRLCINFKLTPKKADRDNFISAVWGFITQTEVRLHVYKYDTLGSSWVCFFLWRIEVIFKL